MYCLSKEGRHVEEENCKHLAKPNVQKKCRGGRCPKWKAGDWGQVSHVVYPFALFGILPPSNWLEPGFPITSVLKNYSGKGFGPETGVKQCSFIDSSGAAQICTN